MLASVIVFPICSEALFHPRAIEFHFVMQTCKGEILTFLKNWIDTVLYATVLSCSIIRKMQRTSPSCGKRLRARKIAVLKWKKACYEDPNKSRPETLK